MKNEKELLNAYFDFAQARVAAGFEPYMLTLMFNPIRGSANSLARFINKTSESLYARILTRVVKRPHNTPLNEMPLWIGCADWPVQQIPGWGIKNNLINDGLHIHAMVFIPPNSRTTATLSEIIEARPESFLIGGEKPLSRIHVLPIERTIAKAMSYTLKSVDRGRLKSDEITVLPRHSSEI